jgi:hypothetical protein
MAREESDREDLLRDATALVERIELAPVVAGIHDPIVIGFRIEGALSIYFGADPVYHFNSRGQLRRAFCGDLLLKAERGRLVSMRRVREDNQIQLLRRELLDEEHAAFLAKLGQRLDDLARQCQDNQLVSVGQVPSNADVMGRVLEWLNSRNAIQIANSPRVS